ncbi:MAG: SH3 domain-containing protein [Candidatus Omnitrophota bacterium]
MQLNLKHKIAVIIFSALLASWPQGRGLASDGPEGHGLPSDRQSHSHEFSVFTGRINANSINVRVDATTSAPVVCALDKGGLVEVVGEAYDWYKIRLPKTAPSYIKKDLVECINRDASLSEPAKCLNAKVTGERVNIRLGPNETSSILGKVDKLTVVNILADKGAWYKIEPVHQSYGWMNKKFVDKDSGETVVLRPAALASGSQTAALRPAALPIQSLVLEGIVSPYGVVLWRTATHKLITSGNKIYFLKGNRKALDSLNYHRVKVTGKLISPANSKSSIIQVAIIEALN